MTESLPRRPAGELAGRPLHFIWLVDCSGSMHGEKIQSLNYGLRQAIPDMRRAADDHPAAQVFVRVLRFATGAQWVTPQPVEIHAFEWQDLQAGGVTDLGKALTLLAEQLRIPPMPERALPPVVVLIMDGQPTDDYASALATLRSIPWWRKCVRVAIAIGQDADQAVLEEFTGNRELVLQANNAPMLVSMIKWGSTAAEERIVTKGRNVTFTAIKGKVQGATHRRREIGCQDACRFVARSDALIAAVADGHGSTACPYSDEGAEAAVRVFCKTFLRMLDGAGSDADDVFQHLSRHREELIPKGIVRSWLRRVERRHTHQSRGHFDPALYGTTLVGLVVTDTFYLAMQLGDGDAVAVRNGATTARIVDVERLLGTETYSLSQDDAWGHVQSVLRRFAGPHERPELFMLSTDGLANSFASEDAFLQVGTDYAALLRVHGARAVGENLAGWLWETSAGGCGDDIAVVLVSDAEEPPISMPPVGAPRDGAAAPETLDQ